MHERKTSNTNAASKCRNHLDLWKTLNRHRTLRNLGFAEYVSIGPYTVEFCSHSYRIVIESDSFSDIFETDMKGRDQYIRKAGYVLLRYSSLLIGGFPEIIVEDVANQAAKR